MKKHLIGWSLVLITLLLLAISVLFTPTGIRLSISIANRFIPGEITYQGVAGYIFSTMEFKDLTYQGDRKKVVLKNLKLHINLGALLKKKIIINSFTADALNITTASEAAPAFPKLSKQPAQDTQTIAKRLQAISKRIQTVAEEQTKQMHYQIIVRKSTIAKIDLQKSLFGFAITGQLLHFSMHFDQTHLATSINTTLNLPYPIKLAFQLQGSPKAFKTEFMLDGGHFNFSVKGQGNSSRFDLHIEHSKLLDGELHGKLQWQWQPHATWYLELNGRHLNLSLLNRQWPNLTVAQIKSAGLVNGKKLRIQLASTLKTAESALTLQAHYQKLWKIQWHFSTKNLHRWQKTLNGELESQGKWQGNLKQHLTIGRLSAKNIVYNNDRVATLQARWNIASNDPKASQVSVNAGNVQLGKFIADRVIATALGNLQNQHINAAIKTSSGTARIVLISHWRRRSWQGDIPELTFQHQKERWQLTKPTTVTVSNKTWQFTPTCLNAKGTGNVCFSGQQNTDGKWHIKISSGTLATRQLLSYTNKTLEIRNSQLSFKGSLTGQKSKLTLANFDGKMTPGTVRYLTNNRWITSRFRDGQLTLKFAGKGLYLRGQLHFPDGRKIQLAFSLPDYDGRGLPDSHSVISGELKLRLHNLDFLSAAIPHVLLPKGLVKTHLKISGTLAKPQVVGYANLTGGRIVVPELNLNLTHVDIQLTAESDRIRYKATALSGGARIQVDGSTDLTVHGFPTQLHVNGRDVLIIDTPEYKLYASPDMNIRLRGYRIDINGALTVTKGIIQPRDFHNVVTLPENEVVFIGRPPTAKKRMFAVGGRLKVIILPKVKIDSHNVLGYLFGEVRIHARPGQTLLATGQVGIKDGTYRAFGRTLTISPSSQIQYARSPINNPNLSIRADRTIPFASNGSGASPRKITVGIAVNGRLSNPKLSLYSIPANFTQAEIMSYLLFDSATGLNTRGDLNVVVGALEALRLGSEGLSGKSGGGFISRLQRDLGFTQLGIQSQTTVDALGNPIGRQTNFVVGKRFTKNLYVRYMQGLSGPGLYNTYRINVRYLFGRNWAIQAETNSQGNSLGQGLDLFYTVDRN